MEKPDILEKIEEIICSCHAGISNYWTAIESEQGGSPTHAYETGKKYAYDEIVSQLDDLKTLLMGE